MEIKRAVQTNLKPTLLKDVKPGQCFRFITDTVEDMLKDKLVWLRIAASELKDRIRIVHLGEGIQMDRDGDHQVYVLNVSLHIDC